MNPFEELAELDIGEAADTVLLLRIIRMLVHEHVERRKFQEKLMSLLDDLKTEVAAVRGVEDKIVALLDTIKQKLDQALANGDMQGVKDAITALEDGKAELAAAITRDTLNPPTAQDQTVATPVNTAVSVTLAGSGEGPLTFTVAGSPSNGALSGDAPNLTYTPNTDFTGTDNFTFIVDDGTGESAPGDVAITVG